MTDGTYVEDVKNPVELQLPTGNHFFVILRLEESRDGVPPTPFDDFLLDLCHSPAIGSIVSELSKPCTADSTHVVIWFIASRTD
jgi:hypothetical protein